MRFHSQQRVLKELTEGSDLSGGGGDLEEALEVPEANPWDEPLGSLQESVVAMEGRFGEQLGPLQSQLQEVQQALGRQTALEIPDDKLAAIEAWATRYDPKLEGLGDLLRDLLSSSVKQTPFDEASLRPHLESFGSTLRYEVATNWLNDVVSPSLSFDENALVNESDPQSPATDLQKAWLQFWQTSSAATRQALTAQRKDGSVAYPREFGQAMLAFDRKWKTRTQEKIESAGGASRRLAGARQTQMSGRSTGGANQLRSEQDGWNSVFSEAS